MKCKQPTHAYSLKSFFMMILLTAIFFLSTGCMQPIISQNQSPKSITSEQFYAQRHALIDVLSKDDPVFSALQAQINPQDVESQEYWRWRIDQYMYGQYPEFQTIYDAYRNNKTFLDIYNLPNENLGPKKAMPTTLPSVPKGHFTENLQGNPHRGWHYLSGDTLYITYQGQLSDPYIASFNLKTNVWEGPLKAGESTLSKDDRKFDSHGRPIIEIDSLGHIHIVYGGHGGEREDGLNPLSIDTPHAGGRMLHLMSKRPYDISEFEYIDDISPFASYTKSYKMGNGDIYLFTRAGTHKSPWVYYKMTAGQQRFEAPVIITWPTPQKDNPINVDTFYINPVKISDTDIAISFLWHECNFLEYHDKRTYSRINAYYVRLDTRNETFYNAQGESVSLPITLAQANTNMLAFDSTDREETPFTTTPILLDDGSPAVIYEARTKDMREHRMTAFINGQWTHSLPTPSKINTTLYDKQNHKIENLLKLEKLGTQSDQQTAMVIYRDKNKQTVYAEATSKNGSDWFVSKTHLSLQSSRIQMEPVKNNLDETIGFILNVRKGASQRLYLWLEGAFRPLNH
ncbi:BNR-4 repeat-containing protein [Glaciecola sp. KUL10]|uniref:BNR-4 repeat-containing protein n=1 Tax=Glaciecola sp. (strain KUL10) TaxID=2161813 RepID=UPI000D78BA9D|nr:BNR-4 repeat-containing protein [Glaciecola sp. KUL10]